MTDSHDNNDSHAPHDLTTITFLTVNIHGIDSPRKGACFKQFLRDLPSPKPILLLQDHMVNHIPTRRDYDYTYGGLGV